MVVSVAFSFPGGLSLMVISFRVLFVLLFLVELPQGSSHYLILIFPLEKSVLLIKKGLDLVEVWYIVELSH